MLNASWGRRGPSNAGENRIVTKVKESDRDDDSDHAPLLRSPTDIGCGFGGHLITLAPQFHDTLIIGLEIHVQYVQDCITALRATNDGQLSKYNPIKFLPNFFQKASLTALFFLFPDPHFKTREHKACITSPTLLTEYAYVLAPGGIVRWRVHSTCQKEYNSILYEAEDVEDLAQWMRTHLDAHPLFQFVEE
ncbi:putative methyltransferase-domain-containing protein [Suillus subalutaceus]|uniref:putative methyltransferase-domain-containing protein n=1 Tax=Suillus subalutaceus TaxID=48586 RepID=UPI001B85EA81|nr:putative methyltransferase-domain-containing protein [Suillus subalutaceus]KAG1843928.1 putative methyltransferase-domain-containing protein [Suillus subalutaceus]